MTTAVIHVPLAEVPAVIAESIRTCLKARGIELTDDIICEASRNSAQALVSIDRNEDNQP